MAEETKKTTVSESEVHPDAHGWEQSHSDANGWKPGEKTQKKNDGKWISRHPDANGWTHSSHS